MKVTGEMVRSRRDEGYRKDYGGRRADLVREMGVVCTMDIVCTCFSVRDDLLVQVVG